MNQYLRIRDRQAAQKPGLKCTERNGFTLTESLICLLIICLIMLITPGPKNRVSIERFMSGLENRIVMVQSQSFSEKLPSKIEIRNSSAVFSSGSIRFPAGITCEEASIAFNSRGNIQAGGHFSCSDGFQTRTMVYQIGTGRVRYE